MLNNASKNLFYDKSYKSIKIFKEYKTQERTLTLNASSVKGSLDIVGEWGEGREDLMQR